MNYKKIRGKSHAACLLKLRQAYGDDVKVISTRKIEEGGLFGSKFLSKQIFEIEYMLPERKFSRKAIQESLDKISDKKHIPAIQELSRKLSDIGKADADLPMSPPKEPVFFSHSDLLERPQNAFPATSPEEQEALNRLLEDKDPIPPKKRPKDHSHPELPAFSKALNNSSELSLQQRHFRKIEELLIRSRMTKEYVQEFLTELKQNLSEKETQEYRRILAKTNELLHARIRVAPNLQPAPGEVKAVIFLGPTGSGKTTALAKIASRYYTDYEVSIYSMDHYRLAATAQLRAYAEIMGLEFRSPRTLDELEEQIHRDGGELLLFDATGVGYRNQEWLEQIREWVDLVRQSIRTERIFCLAANTSVSLLEEMLFSYEAIGIDKILLTKIDESDFIGAFVEYADKFNKPFTYISDGQVVPNDLHEADSEDFVQRVLGVPDRPPALLRV